MKLILLSDVHLSSKQPIGRLDDYRKTCLEKFEYVLQQATEIEAHVLQAGDLFDSPRDWFVLYDFLKLKDKYPFVGIYCLYGQHDTYMYSIENRKYTAMGVLDSTGLVHVLGQAPTHINNQRENRISLWGVNFTTSPIIPKPSNNKDVNILVIHSPICDIPIYPGQPHILAKQFLIDHYKDYDLILCGDIHRHFWYTIGNQYLVNTGPMVRKEATDCNFEHKPCFYIFDTESKRLTQRLIPCKPAEEALSRKHIETQAEASEMLNDFIASVQTEQVEGTNFVDALYTFIKKNKIDRAVYDIIKEVLSRHGKETP